MTMKFASIFTALCSLSLTPLAFPSLVAKPEKVREVKIKKEVKKEIQKSPKELLEWLLKQQNANGSFGQSSASQFQTTAFVLTALADSNLPRSKALTKSLLKAAAYVTSFQNEKGAFIDKSIDRTSLGLLTLLAYQNRKADVYLHVVLLLLPKQYKQIAENSATKNSRHSDSKVIQIAYNVHTAFRP